MRRDKKNEGATRRMVLLEDVAKPVIVRDIPESLLREAYQAISAVAGAEPYPTADGPDYSLENPYGLASYVPPAEDLGSLQEIPAVGDDPALGVDGPAAGGHRSPSAGGDPATPQDPWSLL
jgi:hypothetical protein